MPLLSFLFPFPLRDFNLKKIKKKEETKRTIPLRPKPIRLSLTAVFEQKPRLVRVLELKEEEEDDKEMVISLPMFINTSFPPA